MHDAVAVAGDVPFVLFVIDTARQSSSIASVASTHDSRSEKVPYMNRGAWSAPNSASDTMDAKSALVRPDGTGTRIVHCRQPLIEDVIVLLPRVIGRHDHHLRPLASVADHLPHQHWHAGLQFQVLRGDSVPQDREQPLPHLLEAGELLYGSAAASQGISSHEPLAGLTGEPLEERPLRQIGRFRRGPLLQALPGCRP